MSLKFASPTWVKITFSRVMALTAALALVFGLLAMQGNTVAHADSTTPTKQQQAELVRFVLETVLQTAATDLNLSDNAVRTEAAGRTLSDVIKTHAGDEAKIRTDAATALTTGLPGEVSAGKITQSQSDTVIKNMDTALDRALSYQFPGREDLIARLVQGASLRQLIREVAKESGITPRQVVAEIHGGKTLAQIATEHNADVNKIVSALVSQATDQINKLVAKKNLNQDEANALITSLTADFTDALNRPNVLAQPLLSKSVATPTPAATAKP
jgi:hypothetical protein